MSARWAVWFGVEGDVRFLSHHDMMRLMERAAARAGLPLKHSQGFNPRPKLSLVLPRPVGVASRCELMVLELDSPITSAALASALGGQLPPGLTVRSVQPLESRRAPQVKETEYELNLEGDEQARASVRLAEPRQAPVAAPVGAQVETDMQPIRRRIRRIEQNGTRLSFALAGDAAGPGRCRDVLDWLGLTINHPDAPPGEEPVQEILARLVRTRLECDFASGG